MVKLTVAADGIVAAWQLHGIDGKLIASSAPQTLRNCADLHRAAILSVEDKAGFLSGAHLRTGRA